MRFSVIIPVRNEEANIARCLASLMGCDWDPADFEVIVVDHCSTDQTVSIASRLGAQVLIGRPEATISALRNLGARSCGGEILAFLDADCTVPDNWLRQAARYVDRDEVICFGSPPVVPEQATWVQQAWFRIRRKGGAAGPVDWLESMNMFVRRRQFLEVGGFDERLVTCEDYDLSLRLGRIGTLVCDERIAAVHHGEAASIAHFFKKEYWRGTGNFAGILAHGISRKELPSVALPVVHGILAVLVPLLLVAGLLVGGGLWFLIGVSLLLAWQTPLLALAAWKNRGPFRVLCTLQLYLLLNVYFLARCGSVLLRQGKR